MIYMGKVNQELSKVITRGEKEGERAKAKFRHELTPGASWNSLPTFSLLNRPLESPWDIEYVISTLLEKFGSPIGMVC